MVVGVVRKDDVHKLVHDVAQFVLGEFVALAGANLKKHLVLHLDVGERQADSGIFVSCREKFHDVLLQRARQAHHGKKQCREPQRQPKHDFMRAEVFVYFVHSFLVK